MDLLPVVSLLFRMYSSIRDIIGLFLVVGLRRFLGGLVCWFEVSIIHLDMDMDMDMDMDWNWNWNWNWSLDWIGFGEMK